MGKSCQRLLLATCERYRCDSQEETKRAVHFILPPGVQVLTTLMVASWCTHVMTTQSLTIHVALVSRLGAGTTMPSPPPAPPGPSRPSASTPIGSPTLLLLPPPSLGKLLVVLPTEERDAVLLWTSAEGAAGLAAGGGDATLPASGLLPLVCAAHSWGGGPPCPCRC